METIVEKIRKHDELCKYHDSLIKAHRRLIRAANKSVFAIGRATRIGRRLIAKSRLVKRQATMLFDQVMAEATSRTGSTLRQV